MQLRTRVDTMVARAAQRIWRVRYRENQRVRAVDLRDDQAYHVAMRRRHLSSAHDWGIVSGLALVPPASISEDFRVQPGVAVDIYGRTLALSQPLSILPDELSGFADGDIDIGIRYRLSPATESRCYEDGDVFAAASIDPNVEADYLQHDDFPDDAPPVYLGTITLAGVICRRAPARRRAATRVFSPARCSPRTAKWR
ncbi:MAG: hypothetical protein U0703_25060 [Anaerolineae bacterium]